LGVRGVRQVEKGERMLRKKMRIAKLVDPGRH